MQGGLLAIIHSKTTYYIFYTPILRFKQTYRSSKGITSKPTYSLITFENVEVF